uniref:Uncharacterized protein n=1 Tax=Ditylum brightwellii TaxID=49249 RepID=A0A7S4RH59_9STRA
MNGNVLSIFRSDGNIFGNLKDFNGWKTELGDPGCAYLSERYLQIGEWRIGEHNSQHLSVSHRAGYTAQIYRSDGIWHPGPRTDFNSWEIADGPVLQGSRNNCHLTFQNTYEG